MSLLRDADSLRPHSSQYQRYDLFIMMPFLEAITSNHPRCITSQDIVPRIKNNANTLERTLSSQCFPHAVWIWFTHLRGVKILFHPSHDRVLVCTPSVNLPYQSPASGLTDFCHDRMRSLSFCKCFLLDPFGPRLPKQPHVRLEDSSRSRNVSEVVSVRHVVPPLSSS